MRMDLVWLLHANVEVIIRVKEWSVFSARRVRPPAPILRGRAIAGLESVCAVKNEEVTDAILFTKNIAWSVVLTSFGEEPSRFNRLGR